MCCLNASPYLTAALVVLETHRAVSYIPNAVPSLGTNPRPDFTVALLSRFSILALWLTKLLLTFRILHPPAYYFNRHFRKSVNFYAFAKVCFLFLPECLGSLITPTQVAKDVAIN